jgi:CheY-like chemotaxis protein
MNPGKAGFPRPDALHMHGYSMAKPVVLIVQAQAIIRMSAVHIVEDAGFSALEAGNADDAIKLLESRSDIAAVFTGISLSGSMDGLKLAHAIRDRWPPVHLIVASGSALKGELPANGVFIRIPYAHEDIATALHALFEPDTPAADC